MTGKAQEQRSSDSLSVSYKFPILFSINPNIALVSVSKGSKYDFFMLYFALLTGDWT